MVYAPWIDAWEDHRPRPRLASCTNDWMMGRVPIDGDFYREEDEEQAEMQDEWDELRELHLQRDGVRIARDKVDRMTGGGSRNHRLTMNQWEDFIAVWSPDFDKLGPDEFKGMRRDVWTWNSWSDDEDW